MNKICTGCNTDKEITEYHKDNNLIGGYKHRCKQCIKKYNKQHRIAIGNIDRKEYMKEYYLRNKDIIMSKNKAYVKVNISKIKIYRKEYRKTYTFNRKKHDHIFKLSTNIRSLIQMTFKFKGFKKDSKTEQILGCSINEFKIYLEDRFECWMNWGNHGKYTGEYNDTWQLDHIQPISNAFTEAEIIKLNHYTNYQPLCSRKNLEKSNKF